MQLNSTVFDPAEDSAAWALQSARELHQCIGAFARNKENCSFVTSRNEAARTETVKFKIHRPFPRDFRRKATESIQASKNSFDQTIFAARKLLQLPRQKSLYFPWSKDPQDLEKRLQNPLIPLQIHDTIRDMQPYFTGEKYEGGDNLLRRLAALANKKHTVGLTAVADVGCEMQMSISTSGIGSYYEGPGMWDAEAQEMHISTITTAEWHDNSFEGDIQMHVFAALKDTQPDLIEAVFGLTHFATAAECFRFKVLSVVS